MAEPQVIFPDAPPAGPDSKELGKRLRNARQSLGISQAEVAKEMDLPRTAIGDIERGYRTVSYLELHRLAVIYYCRDIDFLDDGRLATEEDPVTELHRLDPGLKKSPKLKRLLGRFMSLCRSGRSLVADHFPVDYPGLPDYGRQTPDSPGKAVRQGEDIAQEERRRLGLGARPAPDLIGFFLSQGIWAASLPFPERISAIYLPHPSIGKALLVNSSLPDADARHALSVGHAHALFESRTVLVRGREASRKLPDLRARSFASAFLMPGDGVKALVGGIGDGRHLKHRSYIVDFSEDKSQATVIKARETREQTMFLDTVSTANYFSVPYREALIRLCNLSIVSNGKAHELNGREASGNKLLAMFSTAHTGKPRKRDHCQELTKKVMQLAISAYAKALISQGRLMEYGNELGMYGEDLLILGREAKDD